MKNWIALTAALAWTAGAATAAESKVDFAKDIQPLFQQNCIKCHGPEKQKGKLRLDSKEAALKGGKDGPAFVAGDASKSEMVRRISLPKGDDDVMPNEGEPLTKAQIELIRDWINQGAHWPETAAASDASKPATLPGPVLPADFKPSAAEQKAIAALAQKGIDVRPIAANVNWREANLRLHGTSVTDSVVAQLKDIAGLVDLNLANTKVTDAGLAHLKGLTNLMRLHLELTAVSDAGLAQLKGLKNLTYLNVYGTKVTDAGLDHLKGLKYLRNLYVWQSKVTDGGVKKLKAALPNVDVSTGWDITALAKKEEKKEDKPADAKKDEKPAGKKDDTKKEDAAKKDDKKADQPIDKKDEKKADKPAEKKDDQKTEKKDDKKN
jgi:mono/diheme cytochrome c family protein